MTNVKRPLNHYTTPLILLFLLAACSTPAERVAKQASHLGLTPLKLSGKPFLHQAYHRTAQAQPLSPLHIYLEGDGSPIMARGYILLDPTPRNPIMLGLMGEDTTASLYLGRPCYFGLNTEPGCATALWTGARYSPQVVASMAAALAHYLQAHPHPCLRFFGHSGGGTLAMLLAARFPNTQLVVTLAGNLDVTAWSDQHGYDRLTASLNPSAMPPLAKRILQLHLAGGQDKNISSAMIKRAASHQPNAHFRLIEKADHACCWASLWLGMLEEFHELDQECTMVFPTNDGRSE